MPKIVTKITKNCLYCNKEFTVVPCFLRIKYCSKNCYHKHGHIEASKSLSKYMKKYYETHDVWNKGKKWSKKVRDKISQTLKGQSITKWHKKDCQCNFCKASRFELHGRNHPSYIPGLDRTYPIKFNEKLKSKIRKRDNYTCQYCGTYQQDYLKLNKGQLTVHHIDYNKFNCKENNLITLCDKCNIHANANRDYWYAYYSYINKRDK